MANPFAVLSISNEPFTILVIGCLFLGFCFGCVFVCTLYPFIRRKKSVHTANADAQDNGYLSLLSHELKTPMNAILGFAQLMDIEGLSEQQKENRAKILSASKDMTHIINQLLTYLEIQAKVIKVHPINIHLRPSLITLLNQAQRVCENKGVKFMSHLGKEMPNFIFQDGEKLFSILTHLLGNAIKYTDKGTVQFSAESKNNTLLFHIVDSGAGISASMQQAMFKPFKQAEHYDDRRYGGLGLGLFLSNALSTLLKGQLTYKNIDSGGSEFILTVPLQRATEGDLIELDWIPWVESDAFFFAQKSQYNQGNLLSGELSTEQPVALAVPNIKNEALPHKIPLTIHKKKSDVMVLIIDDNRTSGSITCKMVLKLGYRCKVLSSSRAALRRLQKYPYDLIFMDCQMPFMNGFSLTAQLRQLDNQNREIPIIALTADSSITDKQKCLAAGMNDYLSKPSRFQLIEKMLTRWLPIAPEFQLSKELPIEVDEIKKFNRDVV